jgi:MFS family permease
MDQPVVEPSYRALFAVPTLGRVLVAMQLARIAQSMVGVAIVLFALTEYQSASLAGVVTFVSVFPGLLMSPIAGALLDRHGRIRLVILDYAVALGALALIGGLSLAGMLPAWLLVVIAAVSSLTSILSHTGLRSLFPLLVPKPLWERVNAVDSNGYLVATIVGPPLAAALVAIVGGATAIVVIGAVFGLAAVFLISVPDPPSETATTGNLVRDAWQGVVYTWRNRTLRGLGFSISALNISGGMAAIVVPVIVLERLAAGEAVVGLVFALSGVAGVVSALVAGRWDSRGREWRLLVTPMLGMAPAAFLLLLAALVDPQGSGLFSGQGLGLLLVGLSMTLGGLLTGPMDIALFTVRQRRTDPAWMGRAFAVSMAFNYTGFPIGAALAGLLADVSLPAAAGLGVVACLAGALFAAVMVPVQAPDAGDAATGT